MTTVNTTDLIEKAREFMHAHPHSTVPQAMASFASQHTADLETLVRQRDELLEAAKALLESRVDRLFETAARLQSVVEEAEKQ